MRPLNGKEVDVLALLAQQPRLSKAQRKELLDSLRGDALAIAHELLEDKRPATRRVREAAAAFKAWASTLGEARTVA